MTLDRFLPAPQISIGLVGGAIFWSCSAILAPEASAACVQSGSNVECAGVDIDGFRSPQTLTINIRPGAFVQNVISNDVIGICPLSLPAIESGAFSTVLNEGAISTGGVCGFGIVVARGASVVNLGSIRTADLVAHGIIAAENASVRNGGSISTIHQGSPGILGDRGVRVVTDIGSLITTAGGGSTGIEVGALSTITHNGAITVTGDAASGLHAGGESAIINNGSISTSANNSIGVRVDGGRLVNNGHVRSVLEGAGFALTPTVGVSIVGIDANFANSPTGNVTATHIGVRLSGTQGSGLINDGRIEVSPAVLYDGTISANGAAVLIAGGAGVAMSNSGAIVARGGLPALRSLAPRVDLQNSGSIVGDIILSGGSDSITSEDGSSIDGTIDFGAGEDTLIVRGGGSLGRPLMNLEYLSKSGANALRFTRDVSIAQQVNVFGGGGISIDRGVRVATPLTDNIGTIHGLGTLDGALDNSGTVAPGSETEKGILTVSGAFRQFQNGRLLIRISPDGTSDKLLLGGPATLAGSLLVAYDLAAGGGFEDGQRFDVVSPLGSSLAATGELTLRAPQLTFLTASLVRTANGGFAVEIDRRAYESAAATQNQAAAGRMLDRARGSGGPELAPTFAQLESGTLADATTILAGFAPESPGGVQNLNLMALERFSKSLRTRAAAGAPAGRYAWARGFAAGGRSRDVASKTDYALRGGAAGLEMPVGGLSVGIAAARIDGDFSRDTDLADFDASVLGITARRTWDDFTLDAAVAYGTGSPRMQRPRSNGAAMGTVVTDGNVDLWSISMEGDFSKAMGPVVVVPHLGAVYHRARLGALQEPHPLGLRTDTATAESLRGRAGVAVSVSAGRVRPYGDLSMSVELLERQPQIGAAISGVSGSDFVLTGDARRQIAVEAEAGLAVALSSSVEAHVAGEFTANDLLAGRTLSAGLTFRW
ncbi:MAG: hypothetical protein AB7E79_09720 [Rhodospirillaceae bacterium]